MKSVSNTGNVRFSPSNHICVIQPIRLTACIDVIVF